MVARLRAGVAAAMLAGVVVLVVLVVGGLLAAVVWTVGTGAAAGMVAGTVLGAVALVLVLALARVARTSPVPPDGVAVSPVAQPQLWRLVREAADGVGAPEPDEVRLVAEADAGVTEGARLLGLAPGTRVLHVGVPLLQTLTRSQLLWVLGHELGHDSERHPALTRVTRRGLVALDEVVAGLGPRHALGRLLGRFRSAYARVGHAPWQRQELDADRWAATLTGSDAGVLAMRTLAVSSSTWQTFAREYATVGTGVGMLPRGLYSGYADFLSDPARLDVDVERLVAEQPGSPLDPYPPMATRIELLEAQGRDFRTETLAPPRDAQHEAQGDEPALLVLVDAPGAIEAVEEHLAAEGALTRVAWERAVLFGNRRRDEEQALEVMSAVDALTGTAADLGQAVDLVAQGRGPELATHLAGGEPGEELEEQAAAALVRESIEVLVRAALVGAGHAAHVLRWDRPDVIVDDAGVEVDVPGLVDAVPGDPSMADWLLEVLRAEGISRTWNPSISSAELGPAGPEVLSLMVMRRTWRWSTPVLHVTEAGLSLRTIGAREHLSLPPVGPRTSPARLLAHALRLGGLHLLSDPDTETVAWDDVEHVAYVEGRRPRLTLRRGGRSTSYRAVAVSGDPMQACARFAYGRVSLG